MKTDFFSYISNTRNTIWSRIQSSETFKQLEDYYRTSSIRIIFCPFFFLLQQFVKACASANTNRFVVSLSSSIRSIHLFRSIRLKDESEVYAKKTIPIFCGFVTNFVHYKSNSHTHTHKYTNYWEKTEIWQTVIGEHLSTFIK